VGNPSRFQSTPNNSNQAQQPRASYQQPLHQPPPTNASCPQYTPTNTNHAAATNCNQLQQTLGRTNQNNCNQPNGNQPQPTATNSSHFPSLVSLSSTIVPHSPQERRETERDVEERRGDGCSWLWLIPVGLVTVVLVGSP